MVFNGLDVGDAGTLCREQDDGRENAELGVVETEAVECGGEVEYGGDKLQLENETIVSSHRRNCEIIINGGAVLTNSICG